MIDGYTTVTNNALVVHSSLGFSYFKMSRFLLRLLRDCWNLTLTLLPPHRLPNESLTSA